MTTASREAPHHRNLTCYTDYRCRRPDCVNRYNERNRARLQAHKDGTWNRFVDAEPVRQHILALEAESIGPGAIAYTTGLNIQTILDFTRTQRGKGRGKRHRTTHRIADKILAVTVDNHTRGRVDATGTRRRLQALVAAGWPLTHIATHANLSTGNVSNLLRRQIILAATAKAVADTYTTLSSKQPTRRGVAKCQAKRARNWGERERWNTVRYWRDRMDVIDDPHFQPEGRKLRAEILAEEAAWLMTAGRLNREQAAARLGVSLFTVDRALREHPQDDLSVAA
ncbi:hypothetical protein [Streptomyces sp. enrichment culture]|uniref:hypothetical protein n=1 Tax=Streptomyces sp. enrichment culture TaxID=1795815 RepID=UPI003F561A7E